MARWRGPEVSLSHLRLSSLRIRRLRGEFAFVPPLGAFLSLYLRLSVLAGAWSPYPSCTARLRSSSRALCFTSTSAARFLRRASPAPSSSRPAEPWRSPLYGPPSSLASRVSSSTNSRPSRRDSSGAGPHPQVDPCLRGRLLTPPGEGQNAHRREHPESHPPSAPSPALTPLLTRLDPPQRYFAAIQRPGTVSARPRWPGARCAPSPHVIPATQLPPSGRRRQTLPRAPPAPSQCPGVTLRPGQPVARADPSPHPCPCPNSAAAGARNGQGRTQERRARPEPQVPAGLGPSGRGDAEREMTRGRRARGWGGSWELREGSATTGFGVSLFLCHTHCQDQEGGKRAGARVTRAPLLCVL